MNISLRTNKVVTPYDARHAYVSWLVAQGVPIPRVAQWADHSNEVLVRVYLHAVEGDDERARALLADALEREGVAAIPSKQAPYAAPVLHRGHE